jgi:large subunit ribosomal protein L25
MATETLTLPAEERNVREHRARNLRNADRIPVVVYGAGKDAMHGSVDYQPFRRIFIKAGENTIIQLELAGNTYPVLVHDVQYDPVSDKIMHVDLFLIDMNKPVEAKVNVKLVGVIPAVKDLGGTLIMHKSEVTIKCLPKDLLHEIEVDATLLIDFHHSIHVSDIKVPESVEIVDNMEDAIANVAAPKTAEQIEAEEAAEAAEAAAAAEGAGEEGDAESEAGEGEDEKDGDDKKE